MTDTIRKLQEYYLIMPTCAKYIDDTWFGWCFYKLGIDVLVGKCHNPWVNILDIPKTDTHPKWHELGRNTKRNKLTNEFIKFTYTHDNIDSIKIGSSHTNIKIITLHKKYPTKTKLNLIHSYKDTFKYKFI